MSSVDSYAPRSEGCNLFDQVQLHLSGEVGVLGIEALTIRTMTTKAYLLHVVFPLCISGCVNQTEMSRL